MVCACPVPCRAWYARIVVRHTHDYGARTQPSPVCGMFALFFSTPPWVRPARLPYALAGTNLKPIHPGSPLLSFHISETPGKGQIDHSTQIIFTDGPAIIWSRFFPPTYVMVCT